MNDYHKINSVFKRDLVTNRFLLGQWSCPEFEYLQNNIFEFSEKLDGTNIIVTWARHPLVSEVSFQGRTERAQIPKHLLLKLQELFPKEKLQSIWAESEEEADIILYGEGIGEKIQNGGKYVKGDVDFVLFDVRIGKWWLKREDVNIIAQQLEIKSVPIIGEGTIQDAINLVRGAFKSQWGDFIAEGLVIRPKIELRTRSGERIITKIKHKDFQEEKREIKPERMDYIEKGLKF